MVDDIRMLGASPNLGSKWFSDNVSKKLGNMASILSSDDVWVGDFLLKVVFSRLFSISNQNKSKIVDMGL